MTTTSFSLDYPKRARPERIKARARKSKPEPLSAGERLFFTIIALIFTINTVYPRAAFAQQRLSTNSDAAPFASAYRQSSARWAGATNSDAVRLRRTYRQSSARWAGATNSDTAPLVTVYRETPARWAGTTGLRLPPNQPKPQMKVKKSIKVLATAYSSTPDQTDSTPFITANGKYVYDGLVAANFLPFGVKLRLPEIYGDKIFTVDDRMNARYKYRIDLWMTSRKDAKQFGAKLVTLQILE